MNRVTIRMPCSNRCSSSSEKKKKKGKNRDPIKQRESPVSVYKKSLIQPLRKCRLLVSQRKPIQTRIEPLFSSCFVNCTRIDVHQYQEM